MAKTIVAPVSGIVASVGSQVAKPISAVAVPVVSGAAVSAIAVGAPVVTRLVGPVPDLVAPVPRTSVLLVTKLVGPVLGDVIEPVAHLVKPVVTDLTKLVAPGADLVQPVTGPAPPEAEAPEPVRAEPVTVDPPLPATDLGLPVVVRLRAAIVPSPAADCVMTPQILAAARPGAASLAHVPGGWPGSAPPPGESAGGDGFSVPPAVLASDRPIQVTHAFVRSRGDFVTLWRPCKPGTGPG
ncbi:hypothetical protein ACIOD2_06085 [Amycolatopsis sp. NPDC088138]|uniref:hypothetical protein n=1 Tax=Amycolatopsis sp. NPDC088138 TaxID=3363938 RepID=UPI00380558A5